MGTIGREQAGNVKWITLVADNVVASQTDLEVDSMIPGEIFEVLKIEDFAEAVTGTSSYKVLIAGVDAIDPTTPVADTPGAPTLTSTVSGAAADALSLEVTTAAVSTIVGMKVHVKIRIFPR